MKLDSSGNLKDLVYYFLKLGATGFGGPIALVGYMYRDLVERREWLSKEDYNEGLALAQLAPGPLAAQLAIYIGWIKAGVTGATLIGVAFILPSFLMVIGLSLLYLRFGGLSWIQGAFYGIGAAVIAVIALSAHKLIKRTLERDRLLWLIAAISAGITIWTESEILSVFLLSGILAMLIKAPFRRLPATSAHSLIPAWALTGIQGTATPETLWNIFIFFTKSGAIVFGSGLAIVPFLHGGVVQEFQWLTERQFIDAVAVAMITPGPVVITVAFIGFLVAGFSGAVLAALGVFLPCYLMVVLPAPYFRKFAQNIRIKAFVAGVTAAAIGAIGGASIVLGKRAIVDFPSALIGVLTLAALLKLKKTPEPLLILSAGLAGLAIKSL